MPGLVSAIAADGAVREELDALAEQPEAARDDRHERGAQRAVAVALEVVLA